MIASLARVPPASWAKALNTASDSFPPPAKANEPLSGDSGSIAGDTFFLGADMPH